MIGDWISQWPVLLSALGVIFLPGLAVGLALRLRGLAMWALAPAASTLVLSVLALIYPALGVVWTPLSAAVGCLVVIAVAVGGGLALGRRRPTSDSSASGRGLLAVGLAVGIALGLLRFAFYVGDPAAISQSNDAVFHLNSLRWIAETGSASSLTIGGVTGSSGFYPGGWHALASLTMLVSGAAIPVVANMVGLVIAVGVWPLGVAWLGRATTQSPAVVATAAALSSSLLTFPMLMLEWGVLYPYLLSVALLPAAVALVVLAPRWIGGQGPVTGVGRSAALVGVLLLGVLGAMAFAQPATLLAWTVLALCFVTWWAVPRAVGASGRRRGALVWAMVGVWIGAGMLWLVLTRSTTGSHWPPFRGKLEVFSDVLLNSQVLLPPALAVSALMIVGLVVAVRRADLRWLATGWVVLTGLYLLSAAIGQPWLRKWLVGAWYADPYRLAALAPVTVIPLAAIGLTTAVAWVLALRHRARHSDVAADPSATASPTGWWSVGAAALIGALALALAPVVMMPKVIEHEWDAESRYASDDASWLSPDERLLLEDLEDLVPDDARVIGNPSTGTGFGFMLSGADVFPRTWSHPRTSQWKTISQSLRDAGTDPAVCDALALYGNPDYVLDFGEGEETPGRFILPGMTDFEGQPGFEFVAAEGDASLWRLTACG